MFIKKFNDVYEKYFNKIIQNIYMIKNYILFNIFWECKIQNTKYEK